MEPHTIGEGDPMEDRFSYDDVFALMDEVKGVAHSLLCREEQASLQPTGLMLTAFRRLGYADQDWQRITWENRRHFFWALRRAMKQALIDHARMRIRRWHREKPVAPEDLQFYE